MDDGGHVMAQRDDTQLEAHLDALLSALFDDVADHEGHDALGLIALDDGGHVLRLLRLAQHDGYAGDIAGDQRNAEGTDDGIGHEADAGDGRLLIGVLRLDELQALQDLRADGGGETGVQRLPEILLVGDEALEHADAGGQIAQRLDLDAGSGIDRGEEICGIGEGQLLLRAVFGNGIVDGAFGQARHSIRTAVDEIS